MNTDCMNLLSMFRQPTNKSIEEMILTCFNRIQLDETI